MFPAVMFLRGFSLSVRVNKSFASHLRVPSDVICRFYDAHYHYHVVDVALCSLLMLQVIGVVESMARKAE